VEAFSCVICMDLYHDPILMTPCGHSFCQECIKCWLRDHPTCPVCKHGIQPSSLVRNYGLERVAQVATQFGAGRLDILFTLLGSRVEAMTPLLQEMERAVREKVASYITNWQTYMQEVTQDYEEEIRKLEVDYRNKIQAKANGFVDRGQQSEVTDKQLNFLRVEKTARIAKVNQDHKLALQRILQAFKAQLTLSTLPNPSTLSFTITVIVEEPSAQFEYLLKPTTTMRDIKLAIKTHLSTHHMPLQEEEEEVQTQKTHSTAMCLDAPSSQEATSSSAPMAQVSVSDGSIWKNVQFVVVRKLGARNEETILTVDDVCPVAQCMDESFTPVLHAGDTLRVRGKLPARKSASLHCFTATFTKATALGNVSDFFVCEDCKMQWICGSCAAYCHQGHNVKTQIKNKSCPRPLCFCMRKNCLAVHRHDTGAAPSANGGGNDTLCYYGQSVCPTRQQPNPTEAANK
jgi:hypothetical protein